MKRGRSPSANDVIRGTVPAEVLRLSDPAVLWHVAIDEWRSGDPARLDKLLTRGPDIPEFAHAFLARVASGTEKRKRGRKPAAYGKSLRELVPAMQEQWRIEDAFYEQLQQVEAEAAADSKAGRKPRDGSPRAKAIEATADALGISEGRVVDAIALLPHQKRRVKEGNSSE